MSTDHLIGQEIDGYRILRVVGRGGMGVVFKAEDVSLGRLVAIKLIDPTFADHDAYLRRFRREARALAKLRSPHIVMIHSLRRTRFGFFIVMEYVDGGTLTERFGAAAVPYGRLFPLLRQALSALRHAHGLGVVHRDIKPSNIMVTDAGEVRVMDFGIAKLLGNDLTATVTQGVSGTPYYMSPEQVAGEQAVDGRSDLYSLAMTAYHLLAGRLPFEADSNVFKVFRAIVEQDLPPARSFNAAIPPEVEAVLEKALQKHPDDRFQSAGDMLAALDEAEAACARPAPRAIPTATPTTTAPPNADTAEADTTEANTLSLRRRFSWWSRRRAALLLVGLGALALGLWSVGSSTEGPPPLEESVTTDQPVTANEPTAVGGPTDGSDEPTDGSDEPTDGAAEELIASGATPPAAPLQTPPDEVSTGANTDTEEHPAPAAAAPADSEPADDVQAVAERTTEGDAALVPLTAPLRIVVHPWGNVYIDGTLRQEGVSFAQTYTLPVGDHTVSVRHLALGRWDQSVTVATGEEVRLEVDFEREVEVTVTAFDSEEQPVRGPIFVDGTSTGTWPPAVLPLRLGRHRIEVRAPGYEQVGGPRALTIGPTTEAQRLRLILDPSDG